MKQMYINPRSAVVAYGNQEFFQTTLGFLSVNTFASYQWSRGCYTSGSHEFIISFWRFVPLIHVIQLYVCAISYLLCSVLLRFSHKYNVMFVFTLVFLQKVVLYLCYLCPRRFPCNMLLCHLTVTRLVPGKWNRKCLCTLSAATI